MPGVRRRGLPPPTVHQMILTLERNGFITRVPGQGRSIQLLISRDQLPDLD
ncbi:MAG TPA: helix-turn-helix domain-containing protein [Acidobacteriota bacterium]